MSPVRGASIRGSFPWEEGDATVSNKTTERIVGSLILIATVTYMLGDGLLGSILNAPDYLRQVYPNSTQVVIGVLLEFIDAAAVAAIGILLFPILRRFNAAIALGLGSIPFCYLLYRTRLIPRWMAVLGLIGYAALLIGGLLELFGLNLSMIHFAPGGLFELILPIWLIVKGFNESVIPADDGDRTVVRQP